MNKYQKALTMETKTILWNLKRINNQLEHQTTKGIQKCIKCQIEGLIIRINK